MIGDIQHGWTALVKAIEFENTVAFAELMYLDPDMNVLDFVS